MDRQTKIFVIVALSLTVLAVVVVAPLASRAPDGLERVIEDHQVAVDAPREPFSDSAPLADYKVPGVEDERKAIALAGVIGLVIMFGGSYAIAKVMMRTKRRDDGRADEP